jgi:competence protein ComEC
MQLKPDKIGPVISSPSSAGLTLVPLFHAAWLFAAGIVLAHCVWLRPPLLLIALLLVAVVCCFAAFRAQRVIRIPVATLWCLLGAWCAEMEPHPAPTPALNTVSDGLLRTVKGMIIDAAPIRDEPRQIVDQQPTEGPTQRIDLHVSSVEVVTDQRDDQTLIDGGVRLTIRWPLVPLGQPIPQGFPCGEHIRAVARLLPPTVYRDPGAWNRSEYLLDQGITSTASVPIDRVESLGTATNISFACRVSGWQHAASVRLLHFPAQCKGCPLNCVLVNQIPTDGFLAARPSVDRSKTSYRGDSPETESVLP